MIRFVRLRHHPGESSRTIAPSQPLIRFGPPAHRRNCSRGHRPGPHCLRCIRHVGDSPAAGERAQRGRRTGGFAERSSGCDPHCLGAHTPTLAGRARRPPPSLAAQAGCRRGPAETRARRGPAMGRLARRRHGRWAIQCTMSGRWRCRRIFRLGTTPCCWASTPSATLPNRRVCQWRAPRQC